MIGGTLARIAVGLPRACSSLDDHAAAAMRQHLTETQGAVQLLENPEWSGMWQEALRRVAQLPHSHGLVAGCCVRLLVDTGALTAEDAAREMQAALSPGAPPSQGAYWLQGFLFGSGLLLLHQASLWRLIDEWVSGMSAERFTTVLPLLARTFSTFPTAERRRLGESIRSGHQQTDRVIEERDFDRETADASLPLLAKLFGQRTVNLEESA